MTTALTLPRREFLKKSAAGGAGLVIGFYLPGKYESLSAKPAATEPAALNAPLNAWIRIAPDDTITLLINKSETGQGVTTSLSMLLAEELECDWKKIHTEFAPAAKVYFNRLFGLQGTGGSSSIRGSWEPLTQAGAAAREMLVSAAAKQWGVEPSACRAENGVVTHAPSKRRLRYGQLAAAAAALPVPEKPALKDPKDYKFIGKPTKRLDTLEKVNGKAEFGIDVRLPNMLHAVVQRGHVFGGKVASFDATKAKTVPGVKNVFQITSGVAVVADSTWAAIQGRGALQVTWDEGPNANNSSEAIRKLFIERSDLVGAIARKEGDADSALGTAAKKLDAAYHAPFLAHACMEPMNCAADVRPDACHNYAPTQFQTFAQMSGAKLTGLKAEQVFIHTTYLGGGFGRRAEQDFIMEAVELSKAAAAPVQVTWTREDDMHRDYYRPAAYGRLAAGLDADGWPVAWKHRIVSDSIMSRFFPGSVQNGLDSSSVEGAANLPYTIPNIFVDYVLTESSVPSAFGARSAIRRIPSSPNASSTKWPALVAKIPMSCAASFSPSRLAISASLSWPLRKPDGALLSRRAARAASLWWSPSEAMSPKSPKSLWTVRLKACASIVSSAPWIAAAT